ncbi:methyltransferase family protein [Cupriavidus basilensis]|uniref:methyltransferase family protein n=1 Tax=Cupriavidus basilensis TaxID=68895 RepID=UPI001D1F940A|nr:isoprenylcysteine carboxylmethyltransferase family protein [Cupriavidus basilensis]NUA29442.1 isoprenylcysteine carboxylmethyltransferase family protein [Cupriavidus basilensis]
MYDSKTVELAGTPPPMTRQPRDMALEMSLRIATALLLGLFAYAAIKHWLADPTRITLLLIVVAECLTAGLSLIVRVPARRDWSLVAVLCSLGGTYYFMAIQLAPGTRIVPEAIGAGLQIAGLAWQIFAKASLRYSFGILPANRGIVSDGAYRLVRHPIYLGYLVTDIGFLLANFGVQNVLVFAGQFVLQGIRIAREEALLSEDPEYRAYRGKVRYRVLPGVF